MLINARSSSCTLSINVARPDVPFLQYTIPHLVKACRFRFRERMLVVDTAPLGKRYRNDSTIATEAELLDVCHGLRDRGIVDNVIKVDYRQDVRATILEKHLGRSVWETHDFRGAPIYAYLFAYEAADGEYFLHFDADMLFHQDEGEDWVSKGIATLDDNPDVLTVTPLPGPPAPGLKLRQRGTPYVNDERGFFAFKEFTARRYMFHRPRLNSILPLNPAYISWKRKLLSQVTRRSAMERWEGLMSSMLHSSSYIRADLCLPSAWTLHPLVRGPEFIEALPNIIHRVEEGNVPAGQEGDYDLDFELWTRRTASRSTAV